MGRNTYKNSVVQQISSVSLTSSTQAQQTISVPQYNADVSAIEFDLTVSVTGTPSSPNTLSTAIKDIALTTKDGRAILSNIAGNDIAMLTRVRNIGRTVTDPSLATGSNASQFLMPCNIEKADQPAILTVTLNTLGSLATSGISAATVTLNVIFWYYDNTVATTTEKIQKLHLTIASGDNNMSSSLPTGIQVNSLYFRVTTEGNYNYFGFTADGGKELDKVTINQLTGQDNALLVSGHVTGQFNLPVAPYVQTSATSFTCNTSSTDAMDVFLIGPQPQVSSQ
jgi:hypothetical protein